jgi:hypothetical protein
LSNFQEALPFINSAATSGSMAPIKRGRKQNELAQEFHHFPQLPFEIRSMIWNLAIEPRIIHLYLDVLETGLISWKLGASQLGLLATNREARSQTIKTIKRSDQPFRSDMVLPLKNGAIIASVRALHFNYSNDLVYIDIPRPWEFTETGLQLQLGNIFQTIFKEEVILEGRIKNLAINKALLTSMLSSRSLAATWSSTLWKSMKELVLVSDTVIKSRQAPVMLRDVSDGCSWSIQIEAASKVLK